MFKQREIIRKRVKIGSFAYQLFFREQRFVFEFFVSFVMKNSYDLRSQIRFSDSPSKNAALSTV